MFMKNSSDPLNSFLILISQNIFNPLRAGGFETSGRRRKQLKVPRVSGENSITSSHKGKLGLQIDM
jgi:hypothetical protein